MMALLQRYHSSHQHHEAEKVSGLTFAEAYLLQKTKEAEIRNRKGEIRTLVSNIEELHQLLERVKQNLEADVPFKTIKNTLKAIPPHFAKHITEWHDDDKLNILHHAIICDKPNVVTFLLVDTNFFPAKHSPVLNPYAHLAAITGHADCLKTILQHRPASFFASSKPNHAIRLPDHIVRKMKGKEKTNPLRSKHSSRLLERIKMTTKAAEQKIKQEDRSAASDVTALLNKDIGNVDKSFQRKQTKLHVMPSRREPRKSLSMTKKERPTLVISNLDALKKDTHREPKRSFVLNPAATSPRVSLVKAPNSSKALPSKLKNLTLPAHDRNHFIRRLKPGSKKHLITVFWDVASRFDEGVVNRAGEPVKVQYAPNSHLRPGHSDDSISDSAGIYNWPSPNQKVKSRSKELLTGTNKKLSPQSSKTQMKHELKLKPPRFFEPGIRGSKAYKEFHLKLPSHDSREKEEMEAYMNKTPLSYAAEKGYEDCAQIILDMVVVKRNPTIAPSDPLTLAAKARSPETIVLLIDKYFNRDDFQNAVLLSIREMLPDCLTALLSKARSRNTLFEGVNLFHVLFSQCVISGTRFELMPEMTQTLIACKEDVNAHNIPMTFPMYTLINCAFNITIGNQIFFFIDCLHILLENKANPHYDEEKQSKYWHRSSLAFTRKAFSSAVNCIFDSAKTAVNFFEKAYWSKLFMKKFVISLEMFDRTQRRVLNSVLFEYMDAICELGLDRTIVRCLLRYGANPDFQENGKYPVNVYFDKILPYMTKFEIINSYDQYRSELDTLMVICKAMSQRHLSNATTIFLQDHLLSAPIQALPITRQFAAYMDQMLRNPRSLSELTARAIWLHLRRDKARLRGLPCRPEVKGLILP